MSYYKKYMMYKQKYADLKNMLGGASTRGNSYQPALKNMIGGEVITLHGNYYQNMNLFAIEFFKEFNEKLSMENTKDKPRKIWIVLYEKRYIRDQNYDPSFQSNNEEDFYSKEHGGKYNREGRTIYSGEIKSDLRLRIFKEFSDAVTQNNYKLLDIHFV